MPNNWLPTVGEDSLDGGEGNDLLVGGKDNDSLDGGVPTSRSTTQATAPTGSSSAARKQSADAPPRANGHATKRGALLHRIHRYGIITRRRQGPERVVGIRPAGWLLRGPPSIRFGSDHCTTSLATEFSPRNAFAATMRQDRPNLCLFAGCAGALGRWLPEHRAV
jgi:hypothetical protein